MIVKKTETELGNLWANKHNPDVVYRTRMTHDLNLESQLLTENPSYLTQDEQYDRQDEIRQLPKDAYYELPNNDQAKAENNSITMYTEGAKYGNAEKYQLHRIILIQFGYPIEALNRVTLRTRFEALEDRITETEKQIELKQYDPYEGQPSVAHFKDDQEKLLNEVDEYLRTYYPTLKS